MKTPLQRLVLPVLLAVGLVHAAVSEKYSDSESTPYFSLMPKAFQSKPRIDMTVFTTVTDAGRLVAPASPEHPVYYVVHPAGYREFGESYAGVHQPPTADLERVMRKALASQGYLPATDAAHRPSLLVIFTWGRLCEQNLAKIMEILFSWILRANRHDLSMSAAASSPL